MDYNSFKKVLYKITNNGAPGKDLISKNWIKKLTSTHEPLVRQFNVKYKQNGTLPEWLVTERTTLLMKSNETAEAKNYCPIARQKIIYQLLN